MNELVANPALHAAAIYIAILAIGLFPLTIMVIRLRRGNSIGLGDGGNKELAKAIRIHANYTENVPFALAVLLALALMSAPIWVIHMVGLSVVIGRAAHAFGLSRTTGSSVGRVAGMVLTQCGILAGAFMLMWLTFT
jgi:uncharacterized protein